ncbi:MAG: hypothetical protein A2W31_02170 [Planctomycetes bacterium RBG_16_64_10]|nr:MAG: hypothetical protein A2W31_02170 [Planctomycetes bacterium RBG_16_64_10]
MKSATRGDDTSRVEVSRISPHGIWLLLGSEELFLPFKEFPWFRDAPVGAVLHVERPQPHHLYWPDLDADLSVDSIYHPEKFPLISRKRPNKHLQRAARPKRATATPTAKPPRRR